MLLFSSIAASLAFWGAALYAVFSFKQGYRPMIAAVVMLLVLPYFVEMIFDFSWLALAEKTENTEPVWMDFTEQKWEYMKHRFSKITMYAVAVYHLALERKRYKDSL